MNIEENPSDRSSAKSTPPAALPDYELEQEITPDWRTRLLSRKVGFFLLAVGLTAAVFVWGPDLYREIKARRALGLIAEGEKAYQRKDYTSSSELFRKAFTLAPGDDRVRRIIIRYNAEQGDLSSLNQLRARLDDGSATAEENLVLALASLRSGNSLLARRAFDALARQNLPPEREVVRHALKTQLLVTEGRRTEAIIALRSALADLPGNASEGDSLKLLLSELLLAQRETESQGVEVLSDLTKKSNQEGLLALRLLARYQLRQTGASAANADVAARLRAHPLKSYDDVLTSADLELSAPGANRADIIERLISQAPADDAAQRLALARWLNQRRALDQVPKLITRKEAGENVDALLILLDAMAGQKQWREVRALLTEAHPPAFDDAIKRLFLARVADELGEGDVAVQEWHNVHRSLRLSSPETVLYVARYAEQSGFRDQAQRAYRTLAERGQKTAPVLMGLIRSLPADFPAPEALALYDELLSVASESPEVQGDRMYFALLCRHDVKASALAARQLHEKYPEMLSYLSIAALGDLRLDNPAGAEELYAGREIDWAGAPDIWKVVRVAVFRANNQPEEADKLQAMIKPEKLRPQERELLQVPLK